MPSIRITRFAGLLPEVNPKALANDHAQIAHNCLLWDGWLRPMPQWNLVETVVGGVTSIFYDFTVGGKEYITDSLLASSFINRQEPYSIINALGIYNGTIYKRVGSAGIFPVGVPIPSATVNFQNITSNHLNAYPIARTYAVTFLVGESEGPPFVLPQIGLSPNLLYEDDFVHLNISFNTGPMGFYGVNGIRLYRTIPGFDTAEQLGNPVETGFHLVHEFSGFIPTLDYVDTQNSASIPGDLLISDQWMPLALTDTSFLGQTESGWAIAGQNTARGAQPALFQISERYMHAAWPPQNTLSIPEFVQGMAIFYDDVFIGTNSRPYHIHIAVGEGDALDFAVRPFPDQYACIANTLVPTNFGAMYISNDGLIALTAEGDNVTSKRLANPGDRLTTPTQGVMELQDAVSTSWWNGLFFGFTSSGAGFVFNQSNPSNNEYPLSQLVTIDLPIGQVGPNVVNGYGLFAAFGNGVYSLPMPGYGYDLSPPLQTFTWRSKIYVLPGLYTWSAAKVVNDASGTLTFSLYADGVLIYTRPVTHSNPFRLPHQHKAIQLEIELSGTSVVQEVHVATSMRDLTEEPRSE